MTLNPIMEKFYLSILDFAGLKVEDGIILNQDEAIGEFHLDGKPVALPYFEILRNPGDKAIFHLLNENYVDPETAMFNLYKNRLLLEINNKLSYLFSSLTLVATDAKMRSKVSGKEMISLLGDLGEVSMDMVENSVKILKRSMKVNDVEYITGVYLKKGGSINDVPYSAIGKLKFNLYQEAIKGLDNDRKMFGSTVRKKDLLYFINVHKVVFPKIDEPECYTEGVDNKIFRMLDALLRTVYQIAKRINDIASILDKLKEPSLATEMLYSNLDWVNELEALYSMSAEIREIPGQTDINVEVDKVKVTTPEVAKNTFDPSKVTTSTTSQPAPESPQTQTTQPDLTDPNELLKSITEGANMNPYHPPAQFTQPMVPPPAAPVPSWAMREDPSIMARQAGYPPQQMPQGYPQQPMGYPPQQMGYPQQMPQGYPQQPMGYPQQAPQGYPQQMQQGGLQLNPQFLTNGPAGRAY